MEGVLGDLGAEGDLCLDLVLASAGNGMLCRWRGAESMSSFSTVTLSHTANQAGRAKGKYNSI